MIFKWVAITILANIFHAKYICFIHKLVIIKYVYGIDPKKLDKSKCISFPPRVIPAIIA